jgi:hypothetical protein
MLEIMYRKILSIEEVRRRRRKTRECAVEAQLGGHYTDIGIKSRNDAERRIKQRTKLDKKAGEKEGLQYDVLKIEGCAKAIRTRSRVQKQHANEKAGERSMNTKLT